MTSWRKTVLPAGLILLVGAALARLWWPDAGRWIVSLAITGLAVCLLGVALDFPFWRRLAGRRPVREGAHAAGYTVIVLALVVLINFLAARHSARWDLTTTQRFSLAPQTKRVLKSLPGTVEGAAFFTEQQRGEREQFENLLTEYRHQAANLQVEVIDAVTHPEKAREWEVTVAPTVVLRQGGRTARFNTVSEEEFTNAVIRVTRVSPPNVYFVTGHGEHGTEGQEPYGYAAAAEQLRQKQFTVKTLNLAETGKVPGDARVVIVAGPTKPFLPQEASMLDAWLDAGGHLLLMHDPGVATGLEALVDKRGIKVHADVVVDPSPIMQLLGGDARATLGKEYGFHPITERFDLDTYWPMTSSLDLASPLPEGIQGTVLARSSEAAWGEALPIQGSTVAFDEGKDQRGPVGLAVAVSRKLDGGEKPESPSVAATREGSVEASAAPTENRPREVRLVVYGTSLAGSNAYFNRTGNGDLLLNAISWLAGEEDLISIRPKPPKLTPLTLTRAEANWYFWTLVIITPLIVVALGVSLWWRRRFL